MHSLSQLVGVKAHSALSGRPRYRQFYNFLLAEKQRGGRIFGSSLYLEYLRDFKQFNGRPFTMLVISPTGEVFYPFWNKRNWLVSSES